MSRVLVTGGAGTIGSAVVRRLLGDPEFEIRVSDQRPAPDWMREGASVHTGDLRDVDEARRAIRGCSQVIHLAAITRLAAPDCLVVDPWNAFGAAQVFAYASEVAALSAR